MQQILQLLVVDCQQLTVDCDANIMLKMSDEDKLLFAKRFKELCSDKKLPERGRQSILRKEFKVSQEAVRKWLDGESIPTHKHKVLICGFFGVNYEWLATGNGEKLANSNHSKSDQLLEMMGIDKEKDIDIDLIEIIKNATEVPKEYRHQLKRIVETFTETGGNGGKRKTGRK